MESFMSKEKVPSFSHLAEGMSQERMDRISEVATDVWRGSYRPCLVIKTRDIPQRMLGDIGITPIKKK